MYLRHHFYRQANTKDVSPGLTLVHHLPYIPEDTTMCICCTYNEMFKREGVIAVCGGVAGMAIKPISLLERSITKHELSVASQFAFA